MTKTYSAPLNPASLNKPEDTGSGRFHSVLNDNIFHCHSSTVPGRFRVTSSFEKVLTARIPDIQNTNQDFGSSTINLSSLSTHLALRNGISWATVLIKREGECEDSVYVSLRTSLSV